jgi:hypothetical protein
MKLYDLKLKEIEVLDKEIDKEKKNLKTDRPLPDKDAILERKLAADKKAISRTVKTVAGHHNKLLKVIKVYNKKFAEKNKGNLKELFNSITLQLKNQMKSPFFKRAYKEFMVLFLKKVQEFSPDALKNPEPTIRTFIADNWKRIIDGIEQKANQRKLDKKYPAVEEKEYDENDLFD